MVLKFDVLFEHHTKLTHAKFCDKTCHILRVMGKNVCARHYKSGFIWGMFLEATTFPGFWDGGQPVSFINIKDGSGPPVKLLFLPNIFQLLTIFIDGLSRCCFSLYISRFCRIIRPMAGHLLKIPVLLDVGVFSFLLLHMHLLVPRHPTSCMGIQSVPRM